MQFLPRKTLVDHSQKPRAIFRQEIIAFSSPCRATLGLSPLPRRVCRAGVRAGVWVGVRAGTDLASICQIYLPMVLRYGRKEAPLKQLTNQEFKAVVDKLLIYKVIRQNFGLERLGADCVET